jgi:N-acetyl sugar amidotransferase
MNHSSRVCTYCVMDDFHPLMTFDETGRCGCCKKAEILFNYDVISGPLGQAKMQSLVETLKREGQGKQYDAIVGLSGGIDSAYLAHILRTRYNLRLLAIHVDGGWNSEAATRNIATIVRALDLDLHTHIIEWSEMRDLQISFLKAGVFNQDIPQDHAFAAVLHRQPAQYNVGWFLSGMNISSESMSPPMLSAPAQDATHLCGIHKQFGHSPLATFPIMGLVEYAWTTRIAKKVRFARPLNYLNYDKELAKIELKTTYGWADYGSKHSESRWTKFYQDVYLTRKFKFDKRRLHLSSLIVSGQISRDVALAELLHPALSQGEAQRDIRFVAKKLGLSINELEALIDGPAVSHFVYPNQDYLWQLLVRLGRLTGKAPANA